MTAHFQENPPPWRKEDAPADPSPKPEESSEVLHVSELAEPALASPGDSTSCVTATSNEPAPGDSPPILLPDDLRISWSWVHFIFFLLACAVGFIVVPPLLALAVAIVRHKPQAEFQHIISNPGFLIATQVLWFAIIMFFFYMTLAVLRDAPFWRTLGWRAWAARLDSGGFRPWMFFGCGGGLAIFVAVAASRVKGAENTPMEDLFKDPHSALLLMAMAVFIAPLVEETIFRGYLYPLFASQLGTLASYLGMDPARSVRFGITGGILVTGVLFGMVHGAQLGWNWGLVSLLTTVGIIFTFARAKTGTVLASFLMHLGYNSFIAVVSIVATKGFQHMPSAH